jgi:hypothetical protein
MKLFIWTDPYPVSYGGSMLLVVAETVEQAKELAGSKLARWYSHVEYPDGRPHYHDNVANYVRDSSPGLAEPLRVVDLPCAEWHKWEE